MKAKSAPMDINTARTRFIEIGPQRCPVWQLVGFAWMWQLGTSPEFNFDPVHVDVFKYQKIKRACDLDVTH